MIHPPPPSGALARFPAAVARSEGINVSHLQAGVLVVAVSLISLVSLAEWLAGRFRK